jgi:hypothetical protein
MEASRLPKMRLLVLMLGVFGIGCGGGPGDPIPPEDEVTWHNAIAPIFAEHCTVCHRSGGVGGFALDTYDDAKVLSIWVSNIVRSETMPPWTVASHDSCEPPGEFMHRAALSADEIQAIEDWADAGAPEGDSGTALPIPPLDDRSLEGEVHTIARSTGWEASNIQDAESYRCFLLDPGHSEDRYVTGVQVAPDALEVLHHVFAYSVPPERVAEFEANVGEDGSYECFSAMGSSGLDPLMFWLPDTYPMEFPEGAGVLLEDGARILLQAHYHTWEVGRSDATTLSLRWQSDAPDRSARLQSFGDQNLESYLQPGPQDPASGPEFRIPPFEFGHRESLRIPIQEGATAQRIFGFAPRMNYAGITLRLTHEKANGETTCLGRVPAWSIDTMRFYEYDLGFDDLPLLEAGDVLHIECTYDNTSANDQLRDILADFDFTEPQEMSYGGDPLDEQCMVVLGLTDA